jgi:hypothetical protein
MALVPYIMSKVARVKLVGVAAAAVGIPSKVTELDPVNMVKLL